MLLSHAVWLLLQGSLVDFNVSRDEPKAWWVVRRTLHKTRKHRHRQALIKHLSALNLDQRRKKCC